MAVFKVVLSGRLYDQLVQNTFHFQTRANSADTGLADLFGRFDAYLTSAWSKPFSTDMKYTLVDVRQVMPVDPVVYAVAPVTTQGAIPTQAGNPSECVIISLKSVFADRRRSGRWYLSGLPGAVMFQGKLNTGAGLTSLQTLASATSSLFGPNGSEPYELGVYSDPGPDKLGVARPPIFTPYAQLRINLITGSQRRRRIGVGA